MKRSTMLSMAFCCVVLIATSPAFAAGEWGDPPGGWDWFNDDFADLSEWNHDNGSDAWDESAPGDAGTAPGGAMVETVDGVTVLSIEDTGDPRGAGFSDPSNRKIYFVRDLGVEENLFEGGVTFVARLRINPNPIEAPADGYTLHDGGKGMVGIVYHETPANFSFALDTGGLLYFGNEAQEPLQVGDEFQFHSIWATAILAGDAYSVDVYVDGDLNPAFSGDIALGDGSDGDVPNYIAVGLGSTGRDGAVQVDYVGYKAGVHVPASATAVNPSDKLPGLWGKLKSGA